MSALHPRPLGRLLAAVLPVLLWIWISPALAETGKLRERSEIPAAYRWDLSAMCKTDAAWQADMAAIDAALPEIKAFEGTLGQSPAQLLAYFRKSEEINKKLSNCFVFANMAYDQDTRSQNYMGFKQQASDMMTTVGEATSWATPELVAIPRATYEQWFAENAELALYRQSIDALLRAREHVLTPAEERILALSSTLVDAPETANTSLVNTDIVFPTIKDEEGKDVELSEGRLLMFMQSADPRVRREAAIGMLSTYEKYRNTAASLMAGNMARHIFKHRARNYGSCLHASMDGDVVDTTVYLNLIDAVKNNPGPLQRYVELRRRAMNLESIHLYDMMAPIVPEMELKVKYDDAVTTITRALQPLGREYLDGMAAGFKGGWVDVYETEGKTSGAYSWGSYISHPYILLNYNDTMDDLFTTAHEMGHAMHTWFSGKYQPFAYADYSSVNAEVASTFNEALLMDHLLKTEKDPAKRLYLINQYIDNIRGTVITQVIFADYELRMHRAAEAGEPLTAETLSAMYLQTLKDYYGDTMLLDKEYGNTWIRVPHFYWNFYVYKYANAFAASQFLSQKFLNNEKGAREAYIKFLSAGSSKYPVDILKDAGVDMTSAAPIQATMKRLDELVTEMEKLLKQTGRI